MASNGLRRRRNTGATNNNANTMTADEYASKHDLYGPISRELLVDPVRIREDDGKAYERIEITKWLNSKFTSPMTRKPATVADLVPAHDIQQEITELVKRYPNAQIVRDWLQNQPAWYTLAIQRIRNTVAPISHAMSRAEEAVRQVMPSVETCAQCCAKTVETGAGAVVGGVAGGCAGCICTVALSGEAEEAGTTMTDEEKAALMVAAVPAGMVIGAVTGAYLGPERCATCVGAACRDFCSTIGKDNDNYEGGKRKRKTRKGKRKKRRKTRKRKRKRKRTIKKKKRKGKKSRKR